jgi:hypothetical protein
MSSLKSLAALAAFLVCSLLVPSPLSAKEGEGGGASVELKIESQAVLVSFFKNLADGNYGAVWGALSPDSQKYVVAHYSEKMNRAGLDEQALRDQFSSGRGEVPAQYWGQFKSTLPMEKLLNASWVADDLDEKESGMYYQMEDDDSLRFHVVFRNRHWYFEMPGR